MERKLAAILAADIVGYSRMMGQDEAGTVEAVRRLRLETLDPVIAEYGGAILKSMGDGWLVEFPSVAGAVNAAMQIQDRVSSHPSISVRLGVNIGDITKTDEDFYGDGVNIASRLEGIAPNGGLLISDAVYASLDGTLSPSFEGLGPCSLKNISRDVQVWGRTLSREMIHRAEGKVQRRSSAFPLLTVMPIRTNQIDPQVNEIANSLTADFVTFFGGIAWLNTQVSEEPSSDSYVLRTTLRAQGQRIRLEIRLSDYQGATVWSEKSDGDIEDAFDWQDRMLEHISGNAADLILEAETLALSSVPDDKLLPEQCLLMGVMAWKTFSNESFELATQFQARAIGLRPDMADAYAEAIIVTCAAHTMGPSPLMQDYMQSMPQWVEAARPLASGHAMLTLAIGVADYLSNRRIAPLNQTVSLVLRLAPFDARLLSFCGWAHLWSGDAQTALDCFEKSIRYGKLSPFVVASHGGAATALVQLEQPLLAIQHCDTAFKLADSYPTLYSAKSAALVLVGKVEAAREVMAQYRNLLPNRTLREWKATNDYGQSEGGELYFDALRKAGLPEG
ncbi:adenylate/guanylate cyclase domain-containing protein [uncultured Roseobacter sp.]|uniref:adenylate/guanylate cyclase domain-containing protein n=1 Tax=uncultured Roseobacter sp. TaxID=114847 RepID=UPI002618A469|nr:adenylate/guanylate cyclase domain-containing protein [uncultured Roseobacter sp.]